MTDSRTFTMLFAGLFAVEALGFLWIAAVHLGAPLDAPGFIQPRASAAAASALCGLALSGAVLASFRRENNAWEIAIGAQVICVVMMLVVDKVVAVSDVTPAYRIGIAAAGVVGILLMTSAGKAALGRHRNDGV